MNPPSALSSVEQHNWKEQSATVVRKRYRDGFGRLDERSHPVPLHRLKLLLQHRDDLAVGIPAHARAGVEHPAVEDPVEHAALRAATLVENTKRCMLLRSSFF